LRPAELDNVIKTILDTIAAPLLARHGVGYETAGALLCTAGSWAIFICVHSPGAPCQRGRQSKIVTESPRTSTCRRISSRSCGGVRLSQKRVILAAARSGTATPPR
jgi:hypothetical protein